jgi:peptide/nickel transport system permease protein
VTAFLPVDLDAASGAELAPDEGATGEWSLWHRWRHSPSAVVGSSIAAAVVAVAIVSSVWTPYNPLAINMAATFARPSAQHLFGTDQYGRDVLSRLMSGTDVTLYAGVVSVLVAGAVGVPAGLFAAQRGGAAGQLVLRLADLVYAFPALLVAVVLATDFGGSTLTVMGAVTLAFIPVFARVTRSGALGVLSLDYVSAARACGVSRTRIMRRHVLPNIAPLLITQMTLLLSVAVLADAALTYLGLGAPPPSASWGLMLEEAQRYMSTDPLLSVWPAAAIALCVLGFNLLGDGLRDVFDPRRRDR